MTASPSPTVSSLSIARHDRGYLLTAEQFIPRPLEATFAFFADAGNLQAITPPWLHFHIVTPLPIAMAAGTLIDYRLRLRGIPLSWRTEISVWEPPHRFVDKQLRGPYRWWVHEHTFAAAPGGTQMRDRVEYRPLGGGLVHWLLVARDLRQIFAYRAAQIEKLLARERLAEA